MSVAYKPRSAATFLAISKGKTLGALLSENALGGKLDLVAQYNWGTKSAAEINRALVELVGCESFADNPLDSVLDPARGTGGEIYKPEQWTAELPTGKNYKAKVKKRLPATTAAITELPFLFNPLTETCTARYTLGGDVSRGDKKDFEIHATGYYDKTLDREGAGTVLVEKPSGTVTTGNVKETHIVRKSEAAAPGDADYPWDGTSEATAGILTTPSKITSVCAPYFVSVRYYKAPADQTAFLRMEPFYPRWNLTGKATWAVDEKSLVVKWELEGGDPSQAKLKHGQIRVYDKDGLAFFAPLTKDQIKDGSYDLLNAPIHWDKTKVDQKKLPYRIQIQAHSDDEEENGLALAVMPTQVPGYNYEQVQFIGFNIRNDTTPAGTDYLGHANPDTDIDFRCKAMIEAIQLAAPQTERDRKILKVFVAPEFYWRGSAGAYPVEKISTIVPKLREETDQYAYLDWLFVFGTALGYQKHEARPNVPARHGTAFHRLAILRIDSATKITAKVWSMPQQGWKFLAQGQQKVISAPPGAMGPKDPADGGCPLQITLNNTTGLVPNRWAHTVEPVMTILETVPLNAPTTNQIKVASSLCSRIPVEPGTNDVVSIGGSFWEVRSEGKAGLITNVEYVPLDGNYILTLSSPAAYEAGKPLELVEPVSSELFNVALMQKGWHAPHLGDGLREVVTYKEDLSHIDFIRDKTLEFYEPKGRKIRLNSTDDVLLLPTEGGKDIGGASPNVKRKDDSAVGSEINKSGLGGGCVIMIDRITFGMEVCRDHCVHRLFNFYTGSNVRALDPLVQVHLIPSWGMAIGMCDSGKEVSALTNGLVFNVDGSRMQSVARVWDAKYSCDDHVNVANSTAIACKGNRTTLAAGTLYYPCQDCPPHPAYYFSPCGTHPLKKCEKTLRRMGTALTPKGPIDVPLSNDATYFKKSGNVRVFPPKRLPDPDVATAPAALNGIVNGSAKPGFDVEITLNGTGLAEVRAVNVDGAGVIVTSFSVVSDAQVKAKLAVTIKAAVGTRNVTASTFSGPSNAMVFQVAVPPAPTLVSVDPNEGEVDDLHDIVLKGTNLQSVHTIGFSSAGVDFTEVRTIGDGQIDLKIEVKDVAVPGPCTITVTSAGGSATVVFMVKARPLPTVTSVSDSDYLQGVSYTGIIVTGTYLRLTQSASISGGGLTLNSVVVDSDTQITLGLTVADTAAIGDRDLIVTTRSGDSAPYILTVDQPDPPDLLDIDPDSHPQGFVVTVRLTGTDLLTTRDVDVSGSGVTVNSFNGLSDTEVEAELELDETAIPGDRDVTVTTLGGSHSITFEVEACPAPTLASVTPDSGNRGTSVQVTVDGSDVLQFKGLDISGGGVTVDSIDDVDDDTVVATLDIDGSAAPGNRDLTVTNHGGTSAPLVFKVV
jgi:hypothetical protein